MNKLCNEISQYQAEKTKGNQNIELKNDEIKKLKSLVSDLMKEKEAIQIN
jgi:hypothetical protein